MDLTIFDRFCGSTFWDSELSWNTTIPRLTPCFERTVLVWLPTLFLLAFYVIDVYVTLSSNSRNIPWNWKNRGQLVILGLIAITQIIDLSYNLIRREEVFLVDIYTPVIKCISLVLCGTLVVLHKNYGQRSSGLLFIFWFLVVLTGSSQFYTDLEGQLTSGRGELLRITYIITYCLSIILFLMQWLPDLPPMDNKYPKTKGKENPEESASFPSRMTFSWFNSLIWKGYRNPLTSSDLWSTKYQDSAAELFAGFNKHWEPTYNRFSNSDKMMNCGPNGKASFDYISETVKKDPKKPASILLALLKTFGPAYFIATSLQAMDVMLEFISPVLLKMMINFVSSNEPQWRGYLYAVMFLLVSLIKAFIQVQYNVRVGFVGLRIRTAVTSAIYRKALKLSNSARKDSTLGEIVNLMSVDSQTLMNSLTFMNSLLFAPLYIGLALYFLWQQLGPCALTGLAVILVMIPLNATSLRINKKLQTKQMKYKDERTKMMNEVLSGMKVLKLYTWEPSFQEKISAIRNKEIKILKKSAILKSITLYFWSLAPFLVALLTFIVYALVDESHVLDSAKVFVSMSLFNIMQNPLIMVPIVITNLATASVSLKRINRFLNLEELDPARISNENQDEDPLVIENGTFSWDSNEEPILHNINLRVKPGMLVAVVGAIGCGKSSLISAFLAEMYKSFGNVNTKGSIAYVPQVAWIQNSTLQDNILFGKSLDRKRYNNVIEACSLRQDLEMITGGDQCEIGERGINISGGQKQRISLARAVYADCDVYFLDDPLSAVDAHVGKHIFENVIGPKGILGRKTRLLVTHGVSFLPEVDLIVVLKDGMISELGTYRELLDKKGAFSEFLISHLHEIDEEELKDLDVVIREEIIGSNPELHRRLSRQKSVISFTGSVSSLKKRRISQISQKLLNEEPKGQKLIEEEKSKYGRAGWSVYSVYLSSVGITLFLATLVLTILQQGLGVGANYWLSIMADDKDLVVNGTQNIEKRNLYLIVYGVLGACQTSANFFGSLAWFIGTANATNILHFALLCNIMRSPMSFFDTTPLGRILNRFAKEIDVLDNFLPYAFRQSLSFLFSAISTLCIISYSTPIFIAVIVPVIVLYYMVQKLYIATSQQLKRMESSSRSPIYSHFGETVIGATVIRAYSAQDRFIKDSENKVDINQDFGYLIIIASRWLMIRFQLIGNTIIFFSALFAVIGKDYLSPGLVGLSISYTLQVTGILNMLFTMSADIENNIVAVERIKEYTMTPQEAAWDITPSTIGPDWPREGRVELVGYCLRYRKGLDMVLKGINLVINGGEKVGIVGRTGAGKSSVTLGLFRIIEPDGGKILIDGVDISKLGLHSVRSCLTIIPQDPVLFSGSLRMNLDPFDRFSDEQVWRAMELAGLKPFVKGLAAGLQHEVTEGGDNISVGQRQLICLARALLRKTKILILDEATAAVDLETDDIIQKTIRSEFADCTVLTIAHRINTIMDSDKVLVLDHGSVLEYDSPSELLKNKSSSFYSMAHEAGVV